MDDAGVGRGRLDLTAVDGPVDGATLAVVAHGLLNALTVITTAAAVLERGEAVLDADRRASLYELIHAQSSLIAATLSDMVRGLPPDVIAELDALLS